ncbi:MAG: winged helix DNA-binding protein [Sphingomonadales bacterium]|nr:winged helix DNA-binding protein [Sphingomonadales bacterium]MBD3774982.1 winged helix DNA-binding protein [Paracoccaceae bacterium]
MSTGDRQSMARKLLLMGNQALALAQEMMNGTDDVAGVGPQLIGSVHRDSPIWLLVAQGLYDERRRRDSYFPSHLFGEPCWDILLDLYCSEKRNRRMSVSAACIGSASPETTGLRMLGKLEEEGYIFRQRDQADARRCFVRLTDTAYDRMTGFLAESRKSILADDFVTPSAAESKAARSLASADYLVT